MSVLAVGAVARPPIPLHAVEVPESPAASIAGSDGASPAAVVARSARTGVVRSPVWRHLGPLGAARLAALGVSASAPVLYAAAGYGVSEKGGARVFRSADEGRTWSGRGTLAGGQVRALAIDAGNADRAFAATEEGVYVTTDGGRTWRPAGPSEEVVDVDTAPNRAFVYALEGSGRLYRSEDGGQRWEPLEPSGVTSMAVVDRGIVVAGGRSGTVWLSGDNGTTWSRRASPLTGSIVSVTIQPPETISASSGNRLVRSTDQGVSWRDITPPPVGWLGVVAGDPTAPDVIFLGKNGVAASRDGGVTWQGLPNAPGAGDDRSIRSITFVESRPGTVYLNTGASGAWISSDRGSRWRDANGDMTATSVNDVVGAGPRQLYVATDNGVYQTSDAGASWRRLGFGEQVVAIAVDPAGTVYATKLYRGVWKRPRGAPAPRRVLEALASDVVLAPSDPRRVFVSTGASSEGDVDSHYRSLDAGRTWRRIDTGPLTDTKYPQFAIDPRKPARVYAAVYANLEPAKESDARHGYALLKSVDGGSTWTFASATGAFPSLPTVDPLSSARIYLCRGKDAALLRSDDAGVSWRPTGGLPGGVASFVPDPRRRDRLWAVSLRLVLYRSDNAGRSWDRGTPLRTPAGARAGLCSGEPWIDPASERIYVGVQGSGLYGTALPR